MWDEAFRQATDLVANPQFLIAILVAIGTLLVRRLATAVVSLIYGTGVKLSPLGEQIKRLLEAGSWDYGWRDSTQCLRDHANDRCPLTIDADLKNPCFWVTTPAGSGDDDYTYEPVDKKLRWRERKLLRKMAHDIIKGIDLTRQKQREAQIMNALAGPKVPDLFSYSGRKSA